MLFNIDIFPCMYLACVPSGYMVCVHGECILCMCVYGVCDLCVPYVYMVL